MPKDKPQMDNLTLLSRRQGPVSDKVWAAASTEGMDAKEWGDLINFELPSTVAVKPSERFRVALETLTRTKGYTVPENLAEFFWMLFDEFAASRQEYIRRGWTALEPDAPEVKSSMTQPLSAEKVMGPLIPEEEEYDE